MELLPVGMDLNLTVSTCLECLQVMPYTHYTKTIDTTLTIYQKQSNQPEGLEKLL